MITAARIQAQDVGTSFERMDAWLRRASDACDRQSVRDIREAIDQVRLELDTEEAFRDARKART